MPPEVSGGIVLKKLHPREEFLQHDVQLPRILFKTLHAQNELKTFDYEKRAKSLKICFIIECAVSVCSFKTL